MKGFGKLPERDESESPESSLWDAIKEVNAIERIRSLEIFRCPGSAQALEELTNEEFARQESRGFLGKAVNTAYRFARGLAVPAAVGAVWGGISGDLNAAKEGAYYGAMLGAMIHGGYHLIVTLPRKVSGHKLPIPKRKIQIAQDIILLLDVNRKPVANVVIGSVATTLFYLGVSFGIDLVVPTDNILNTFKVDNGLAARIGMVDGFAISLSYVNSGRKWYDALKQRISRISGVVEGAYHDVTRQPHETTTLPRGRR